MMVLYLGTTRVWARHEEFKRLPNGLYWQVTAMFNPKPFLTATICLGALSLPSQAVPVLGPEGLPSLAQSVPRNLDLSPQSDAEHLGVQEVDLSSLETKLTLPRRLEGLGIRRNSKVKLAPGQRQPEQVTAENDRGIQVQITP